MSLPWTRNNTYQTREHILREPNSNKRRTGVAFMARWKQSNHYRDITVFCLLVTIMSLNHYQGNRFASIHSESTITQVKQQQDQQQQQQYHKHDFAYDRERWRRNRPRIAVLAGPHKTASSTLQSFFASIAGSSVRLTNATFGWNANPIRRFVTGKERRPHPSIRDWIWPLGVREEYERKSSLGGGFKRMESSKFYAVLASLISGRRRTFYIPNDKEYIEKARDYHKALFRRPWEEGKNIVFGAEAFDTLVKGLVVEGSARSDEGEETHVSPASSEMIDALLDIFPWEKNSSATTTTTALKDDGAVAPLRLEDIEVHINYRTPKISHVRSIWHEVGHRSTLRQFLTDEDHRHNLYMSNSLALALQFVRRGIKTTILDMAGAVKQTSSLNHESNSEDVIGGLQGIVACEILRMGEGDDLCDDNSRLHLLDYKQQKYINVKTDKNVWDLTPEEMDEINRAMEEYDCGVWQHLRKYQANGTLRILYPGENLFGRCNPEGSRDISFERTMSKVKEIASRDD